MQPKSFRSLEILHKYVIMYPIPKRMVIQMKIDVITYRDKLYDNMLNGHTVIVIDVLRCTSAIIAALDNGAAKIIPAVEPGDATAYANRIGIKDCILGGERGCLILPDSTSATLRSNTTARLSAAKPSLSALQTARPPSAEFATRGIFFSVHSATVLRLQERLPVSWTTF